MRPDHKVVFEGGCPFNTSKTDTSASDPLFLSEIIFPERTRPINISLAEAVCDSIVVASVQLQAYVLANVQVNRRVVANLRDVVVLTIFIVAFAYWLVCFGAIALTRSVCCFLRVDTVGVGRNQAVVILFFWSAWIGLQL